MDCYKIGREREGEIQMESETEGAKWVNLCPSYLFFFIYIFSYTMTS